MTAVFAGMTGDSGLQDAAAIIVLVVGILGVVLVTLATLALLRTLAQVREVVEDVRVQALPAIVEFRDAIRRADGEIDRVDNVLVTAESIGATVDSASRLAYLAFSNPVIKGLAAAAGTGRAVRRFRRADR